MLSVMNKLPLAEHRTQLTAFGEAVLRICGIESAKISDLQRQISGAFLFGIVYSHGKFARLTPPDVHALAISALQDVLNYRAEQAGAFATRLIQASGAGPQDTTNAIIHRAIDAHRQLTADQHTELRQNLLSIFKTLNAT